MPLDLHMELLVVKAPLRSYLLPFSSLRTLLASEDLANSLGKFAVLGGSIVGIRNFNVLEFKFTGGPAWTFPPIHICLFFSKLVKASHSPSE